VAGSRRLCTPLSWIVQNAVWCWSSSSLSASLKHSPPFSSGRHRGSALTVFGHWPTATDGVVAGARPSTISGRCSAASETWIDLRGWRSWPIRTWQPLCWNTTRWYWRRRRATAARHAPAGWGWITTWPLHLADSPICSEIRYRPNLSPVEKL